MKLLPSTVLCVPGDIVVPSASVSTLGLPDKDIKPPEI